MQNIDLMNLAGFCRNCLSNWMKDAADTKGVPLSKHVTLVPDLSLDVKKKAIKSGSVTLKWEF